MSEVTEISRSASAPLRSADWRFLLPAGPKPRFHHAVVVGASPGLVALLEQLGMADRITPRLPLDNSADVVAVVDSEEAVDLQSVRRSLTAGGVVYLERSRAAPWTSKTPRGLRRDLAALGFSDIRSYAVAPTLREATVYVPLGAEHALRWYVTAVYDPPGPLGDLLALGVRALGGMRVRPPAGLFGSTCVTAVLDGGQDRATVLSLGADWSGSPSEELYPLVLADAGNRIVMLPFSRHGRKPECILKIPKVGTVSDRTENEHRALQRLRERLPDGLSADLPEPLGLGVVGGTSIAGESFLSGTSLKQRTTSWWLPRQAKVKDLDAATGWLADFHLSVVQEHQEWPDAIRHWVREPTEAYLRAFGGVDEERRLFERALIYAESLPVPRLPIVWQHRDFNIWNVLRDGDQIRVLDWEGLRPGPALCDLLHFATHWHEAVVGTTAEPDRIDAFRRLWLNPVMGDPAIAARRAVDKYLTRLQMDRRLLPLLLLYTWLELALRRAEQQRDQGSSVGDAREGNRNFAYLGVLAESADHLFPTST